MKQEAAHPEIIAHLNAFTWADLELPLGRHHFGIRARDVDTRVEASAVVSFNDVSAIYFVGAHSAVVRPLRSRETVLWPAKRMLILIQESVFLFNAKPRLLIFTLLHDLIASFVMVGFSWLFVVLVGLAKNNFVVAKAEGIAVHGHWVQVHIRIVPLGLASR